ncbi:MAG: hypothetical protein CMH48_14870 [Muricauda sp.]|nr:DUF3667 domain-containing protein [Allomuricauda sp.]MBC32112.1 hypothetical protein [Allomuricauda sp.]|tara:strand:+ start:1953 stop:3146 length:1194 start_codon:yes stop_codon:yes gene_type:complete
MGKGKGLITKGRYELRFRGNQCLNCGHPLDISDKYCPNCSQANSTKKLVLKDFFDEFFSSLVNYDSKLLKTLYTLLVKPGTITKDYIAGKRVSYTNPFRFLLSLAFIYFLLFTYDNDLYKLDQLKLDEKIRDNGNLNFSVDPSAIRIDSLNGNENIVVPLGQIDSLAKEDPRLSENLDQLDSLNVFIQENIERERISDSLMLADPKQYFGKLQNEKNTSFADKLEFFIAMIRKDSLSSFEEAQEKYGVKASLGNRISYNASKSVLKALAQPGTWLNDTISQLPFIVFFFLPIFTIFIWVVYIRKKYTYTDHLIFSFHNQSLLFILLILSLIVDGVFNITSAGLFLLVFGVYLYKAMRNFYGQGRFKTIVKYIFLNTVFAFLALLSIILLFTGSVFTY